MENYKMWIGGEWVNAVSGKTYTVVNPATEEEIAQVPLSDKADVARAVEAARKAFPIWSKKPQAERSKILTQIAESIRKQAQDLVKIDVLDHASPITLSNMGAQNLAYRFDAAAEIGKLLMGEGNINLSSPASLSYLQQGPLGVCACITPWNVPIMNIGKVAAVLSPGNACILKPPSVDSLVALKLAEILAEHDLPPGIVNVVTGPGGSVGGAIAAHPGVDMVSFTGSTEAGRSVMTAASPTVKRLSLELGGKNPFIVLADADLDAAVKKSLFCSYFYTGMICAAPGRYYIHEKFYDEFVDKFVEGSRKVVVGDPNDKKTEMGPVVSAEHRDRVENYIKIGIEEGAKLLLGGKRPTTPPLNKGFYIMPTVFGDVTQDMTIAREEIFGPVACFMKFSSEDEVLKLANDNIYGLGASIWTKSVAKSRRFADELNAGTVWINDHMGGVGELPWGGFKQSGFGKINGPVGMQEFTQVKVVSMCTA